MPPLLNLADEAAYRAHYEANLCRGGIVTHDGIPLFFRKTEFDHAFYESSDRRGANDVFSLERATRMDWIVPALLDPQAQRFQGWDSKRRCLVPWRRVTVVIDNFVIVISLNLHRDGNLRGRFITCYRANNSIAKINQAPAWSLQECLNALR